MAPGSVSLLRILRRPLLYGNPHSVQKPNILKPISSTIGIQSQDALLVLLGAILEVRNQSVGVVVVQENVGREVQGLIENVQDDETGRGYEGRQHQAAVYSGLSRRRELRVQSA